MGHYTLSLLIAAALLCSSNFLSAQNPIIRDQFSADPSARIFRQSVPSGEGRVYVYPSHDILAGEGRGRVSWFCMEDYHVPLQLSFPRAKGIPPGKVGIQVRLAEYGSPLWPASPAGGRG